jgi:hypothetical protein
MLAIKVEVNSLCKILDMIDQLKLFLAPNLNCYALFLLNYSIAAASSQ